MENINWVISEEKRKQFDAQYVNIIKRIPSEFLDSKDYMPYWYSEFSFPTFNRNFIEKLPHNYRQEISNLYNKIIKSK
jgi:hypothetical protein